MRFPEFRDAGEWEEKMLEDIADSENSSLALNKIDLKKKGYSVYGANGVVGYIDEYQQDERYISIIKDGAGIGRLNLCQPKSSILGTLTCIKSKNLRNFNLDWIYYQMNIIDFTLYKKGSGIPHIYFSDFKAKSIGVPQPREQQKIAACLTALDDLISAATGRLNALKQHKQGLMQQLFPAEGETVPRLRFPEFRDAGEWEVKEVGEIFTVTRGYVLSMNLVNNQISDATPYPVYSSQTKNNGLSGYYSEFLYEDAITWTTDGANAGDVNYRSGKFYCTNVCGVLINTEGYTNLCVASLIDRVAKNHVSYVGNPKLMNGIMSKIRIPIPSFIEQQKIAACLTALDDLISAQAQKIAKLKTHKRGLMQGLFPKIEH